jgi:dTDP-4-amino-4,6-dideoxygalactose transaminase
MEGEKTSQAQQFLGLANLILRSGTTSTHHGPMPFDCPIWPPRWPEIEAAAIRVIRSGEWGKYQSATRSALETRIATTFGASAARLCSSGTAALEIALRAAKVGTDDEVVLAAYDYPGNFRTIELVGARPVLADVSADTLSIDRGQVERCASDRVKAVVASHLCGTAAEIAELRGCCDDHGWLLIEDACQATGMKIDRRPAGSFGHFATLSFGGSKLISAGSGGALLVNSDRLAARLGGLLDRPGDAFPLSPLQASVIAPQLDRLDELNQIRHRTVQFLEREVAAQLPRWRWILETSQDIQPAFYKLAWLAESSEHRGRIIEAGLREALPIGPGFRSMSRCSPRRCRKPIAIERADELSQRLVVLDHRALLLEPERHDQLVDCLRKVHDGS